MATKNTTERINFATSKMIKEYPDFLDIQVKSFQDFFQLQTKAEERGEEGLYKTFMDNFPITDTRNQFVLEFLDYFVDPPRYSIQECIERGLNALCAFKSTSKTCIVQIQNMKILKLLFKMFILVQFLT